MDGLQISQTSQASMCNGLELRLHYVINLSTVLKPQYFREQLDSGLSQLLYKIFETLSSRLVGTFGSYKKKM